MSIAGFLDTIVCALNGRGIEHMVSGSMASTHHSRPRTTQDVDMVIEADSDTVRCFVEALPSERFYLSEEAALDAVRRRSMFNVIDIDSGWKVDLFIRKDRDFSRAEFARRQRATLLGIAVFMATAEDTVLARLEWASTSGSERQMNDVAAIIEIVGADLGRDYIETWAGRLGVDDLWRGVSS